MIFTDRKILEIQIGKERKNNMMYENKIKDLEERAEQIDNTIESLKEEKSLITKRLKKIKKAVEHLNELVDTEYVDEDEQ